MTGKVWQVNSMTDFWIYFCAMCIGGEELKITIEDANLQGIKMGGLPQVKVLKGDIKVEPEEVVQMQKGISEQLLQTNKNKSKINSA